MYNHEIFSAFLFLPSQIFVLQLADFELIPTTTAWCKNHVVISFFGNRTYYDQTHKGRSHFAPRTGCG